MTRGSFVPNRERGHDRSQGGIKPSVNYAINLVILFIVASIGMIQISMGICLLMDLLLVF